jgi:hypothetical protein
LLQRSLSDPVGGAQCQTDQPPGAGE